MLGHLVRHVFEGTVDVSAFAQVSDRSEIPDEVLSGCELAEDHLLLGEVQPTYGPSDLDMAPVLLISQPLGKDLCEFSDTLHQAARWGLLQCDGFWGVNSEVHPDGTVDYTCWRRRQLLLLIRKIMKLFLDAEMHHFHPNYLILETS